MGKVGSKGNNLYFFGFLVLGLAFFREYSCAHVEVSPSEALVLVGDNVTFVCRVAAELQYCRVEIPGESVKNLKQNKASDGIVKYYGAGLNAGQCGFTIISVKERHNGEIKCTLGVETENAESLGRMRLIVARSPEKPKLEVSRGPENFYKIHDVIHASCDVSNGRPVANISWFLDDEPIYDGLSMPVVVEMAKDNLQSKFQNLTRQLKASDNGKRLRCVVSHPAYRGQVVETSRQLDVEYPPQPMRDPLEQFGYQIGQPGVISLIVEANPKPKVEWAVSGEMIREGSSDGTGRIESQPARELSQGRYEVNLRMAAVNKEDTEKEYVLIAQNNIGRQTYTVRISTSPEPEGLELGLGSIIGIVIAVCVLLLVIFIIIFAKTTGRWCFSGPRERPLGESSDTESADDRPKFTKRNLIPIKLTQYFKKGKNTNNEQIQHNEEDDEPKNEEVEDSSKVPLDTTLATENEMKNENKDNAGVVYAELDLVSPTLKPVVKNDNDKTEYAEIVYTSKENEKKEDNKK